MSTCCCNDKIYTSNVFYDGAYLPVTQISPEDDGNTIIYKIEEAVANSSGVTLSPGTGISINKVGSVYTITNTAPNINQSLSIVGNVLSLSNGGGSVTLPAQLVQTLSISGSTITLSDGGGSVNLPSPAPQTLTWNNTDRELTISGGNTVVIPPGTYTAGTGISIVGNTITNTSPNVTQTLSIVGNTISLSGGGGSVIVRSPDGSETILTAGSNVTITGTGTSANPYVVSATNTVYSPGLSLVGNDLTISGGNTVTLPIPSAPDGSETKVTAGTNVTVTGSGTSGSPYVINASTGIQTLSILGNVVTLSNGGGSINLPEPDGSETKINSGTGISITGSGTTLSPYVINSTITNELENNSYGYVQPIVGNGFDTNGGLAVGETAYVYGTTYEIEDQDFFVVLDTITSSVNLTLPAAANYPNRIIWMKLLSVANGVMFVGQNIYGGSASFSSISQKEVCVIKSSYNGVKWVWEIMMLF